MCWPASDPSLDEIFSADSEVAVTSGPWANGDRVSVSHLAELDRLGFIWGARTLLNSTSPRPF